MLCLVMSLLQAPQSILSVEKTSMSKQGKQDARI
jgi:hypothetical protein